VGPFSPVSGRITAVLQVVVPCALNIDVMLCHSLVSIILKSLASMSNHCARWPLTAERNHYHYCTYTLCCSHDIVRTRNSCNKSGVAVPAQAYLLATSLDRVENRPHAEVAIRAFAQVRDWRLLPLHAPSPTPNSAHASDSCPLWIHRNRLRAGRQWPKVIETTAWTTLCDSSTVQSRPAEERAYTGLFGYTLWPCIQVIREVLRILTERIQTRLLPKI